MLEGMAQVFDSLSDMQKQETLDFMNFLRTKPNAAFNSKSNFRELKKFWGKVDLDIDLDVLRDRK